MHRKTKIIATVGPSSIPVLAELIEAGVNVFRLNFSHGSHESHSESLRLIREAQAKLNKPVAVLQDLSGPKIRITELTTANEVISLDDEIIVRAGDKTQKSNAEVLYVEGLNPASFLEPGHHVLLADGIMLLEAKRVVGEDVYCRVVNGGKLRSRIGIAFPDSSVNVSATTDKDIKDLGWGIENKVDFVAISFVRDAHDVNIVRKIIKENNRDTKIIAKIERKEAISQIPEILEAADALMVARGDLGLEVPLERLPKLQREIIERSNAAGKPVIVATQMLHSMVHSARPTRAEVSDVATAVKNGADCVMLSEETAIGDFPLEAVKYLGRIALQGESDFEFDEYRPRLGDADRENVADSVCYAACAAAFKLKAAAIIACTQTGTTARLVAKYRPFQPLYATTSCESTYVQMNLMWGVQPIKLSASLDDNRVGEINSSIDKLKEMGIINSGDKVIIIGGVTANRPGSTSMIEILEVR